MKYCLFLALLGAACASGGGARPTGPSSQSASSQPAASTATSAADQLALEIARAAGGDRLGELSKLTFSFVVYEGADKKFAADHVWDLKAKTDRVKWTDRQGKARDVTVSLEKQPEGKDSDEAKAYARWVNDTYWFVLPLKLMDPGVRRKLEAPKKLGDREVDVLRLTYDRVGLTPGDTYWLLVDRETKRIVRWEMVLEGDKPPPEGSSWEDYRQVGPLMLGHNHVEDDGKHRVVIEGVHAE